VSGINQECVGSLLWQGRAWEYAGTIKELLGTFCNAKECQRWHKSAWECQKSTRGVLDPYYGKGGLRSMQGPIRSSLGCFVVLGSVRGDTGVAE
jgi:hypothetical protein